MVLDPSAASFKAQLKKDGFQVKSAINDVLDGIRFVAGLLTQGKILFDKSCENTIKEFGSYIWDARAAERGEDKPVKERDHGVDAVRYQAYTIIRRRGGMKILE